MHVTRAVATLKKINFTIKSKHHNCFDPHKKPRRAASHTASSY
jgi:hypothetical protein